jgi:hypothetical protein
VKNPSKNASSPQNRAHELRTELAHKIASFVGSAEKLITNIPGLMLSRRTAPTAPASVALEPSLAVVAQGRKRIDLGRTTFTFDQSRFLPNERQKKAGLLKIGVGPAETSGQVKRKRKSQGLLRFAEVTSGWLKIPDGESSAGACRL